MAPDDHDNQSGHHQPLENDPPLPLLNDATATIYLDGLIYAAYNKNRRVLESAVLTHAKHHHLTIEVRLRGEGSKLFPTAEWPWNPDHHEVEKGAPFWLYVDSGNGIKEDEFSAELHTGNDKHAFNSIFNFEEHHRQPLPLMPGKFAVFNFPHGTCYSAKTEDAEVKVIPANQPVASAVSKRTIPVSNLVGIDINAISKGTEKKWIVLANKAGEFFRFELEPGKQYEINILNEPEPDSPTLGPEGHFLQFYQLFDIDPQRDQRFLVVDPTHAHNSNGSPPVVGGEGGLGPPTADNPPCAPGRGSSTGGLGSGG